MASRPSAAVQRPPNGSDYPGVAGLSGRVLLEAPIGSEDGVLPAVRDGNRSVVLPGTTVEVGGRGYALNVKGVGARPPLYGSSPTDFVFGSDYGPGRKAAPAGDEAVPRQVTAESWFGEAPYGAQGDLPVKFSLMVTGLSKGCQINGFWICPTVEVNEFPDDVSALARDRYWYRRNRGRFLQEQRLVPSNVRLYHESEWTLGQAPAAVLEAFGVETVEDMDGFIHNYIASGIAALTVYVRTMRNTPWGFRGLNYGHVFLDKDAVIAPDGTLHFADIEGLDWILGGADIPVAQRIREQFDYNFYEVMYGLDVLLRERERIDGRPLRQDERRWTLPERFEMALQGDRFVRCERQGDAVDLVVQPPFPECPEVPIRVLDLR